MFEAGGASDVAELQNRIEQQQQENQGLQQRNDALAAEVRDLKRTDGGEAIEDRARSELGMIKPGEVFYRVVEDKTSASPTQDNDGNHQEQQ